MNYMHNKIKSKVSNIQSAKDSFLDSITPIHILQERTWIERNPDLSSAANYFQWLTDHGSFMYAIDEAALFEDTILNFKNEGNVKDIATVLEGRITEIQFRIEVAKTFDKDAVLARRKTIYEAEPGDSFESIGFVKFNPRWEYEYIRIHSGIYNTVWCEIGMNSMTLRVLAETNHLLGYYRRTINELGLQKVVPETRSISIKVEAIDIIFRSLVHYFDNDHEDLRKLLHGKTLTHPLRFSGQVNALGLFFKEAVARELITSNKEEIKKWILASFLQKNGKPFSDSATSDSLKKDIRVHKSKRIAWADGWTPSSQ